MTKKIIALLVAALLSYSYGQKQGLVPTVHSVSAENSVTGLSTLYANQISDVQVRGQGIIKKTLPDDTKGSKHQRFILQINDDLTVLVAHNIDLAARIPGLKRGDLVEFFGEYEWNNKGGVIHWTHHDPKGRHADGWLKHAGKIYQ